MRIKLYRGWWYAVWREGGATRRRALRTRDRDAAERALADYEQRLSARAETTGQIYAAYLEDRGKPRARWAWKRLASTFGPLRPDQITRKTCRDYATDRRRAGASDGTIWTELTFLRAALRWADKNTPARVEMPPKPPPQEHYLTRAQFEALLEHAEVPHLRLFIVLALATAGREAAILDLTWDRVDFERGVIRLGRGERRVKGRATVAMNSRARAELEAAYRARSRGGEYVIEYGGKHVERVIKAFKRAAADAGVPWCSPHVLRHTAAVWMAEAGVPMAEIAQFLGHSDSRITERVYARFGPEYLKAAADVLG